MRKRYSSSCCYWDCSCYRGCSRRRPSRSWSPGFHRSWNRGWIHRCKNDVCCCYCQRRRGGCWELCGHLAVDRCCRSLCCNQVRNGSNRSDTGCHLSLKDTKAYPPPIPCKKRGTLWLGTTDALQLPVTTTIISLF